MAIDKTSGPDNALFKGLKTNWNDIDKENCHLTRFDWDAYRGSWLESQAQEAKDQLRMIVRTEAFKNSEVIE